MSLAELYTALRKLAQAFAELASVGRLSISLLTMATRVAFVSGSASLLTSSFFLMSAFWYKKYIKKYDKKYISIYKKYIRSMVVSFD